MSDLKIKTVGENGTFEEVIAEASPDVKEIAYALRALLAQYNRSPVG